MKTLARSLVLAVALLVVTSMTTLAGGWAVITLDELPTQITAGQALSIGFTVRQHGRTLRSDLRPIVRFDRIGAKESFEVTAQRQGGEGHYVAEISFPNAGQWNWWVDIKQFGMMTQDMSPLTVVAAPAPVSAPSSATTAPATNTMSLAAGAAGVVIAIGALLFWLRTRARLALVVVAVAALGGVIGFTTAGASVAQPVAVNAEVAAPDQVALGHTLFIDKGCTMCHMHPAVKTSVGPFWIGAEPPKLSDGRYSAEYLRQWLKDPRAIKPATQMPNLGLKQDEIEALIAFLNATGN